MNSLSRPRVVDDSLPPRPLKDSIIEVAGMSVLALLLTLFIGFLISDGGDDVVSRLATWIPGAGAQVLLHIGWGFGVYIPVMFGFYVTVFGGQLVSGQGDELRYQAQTQRALGIVGEAMAASLAPSLLLIVGACLHDRSHVGALFVVLPAAGVMFFLAIQLGRFVVFTRSKRREMAIQSRDWAKKRLLDLRVRGRRPIFLVGGMNAIVGGLIGLAVTVFDPMSTVSLSYLCALYMMMTAVLSSTNVLGLHDYHTARDRPGRYTAWLPTLSLHLAAVGVALILFESELHVVGAAVLAVVVFCILSAVWPRRRMSRVMLDWSINGGATAFSAKSIARTYTRAVRVIHGLKVAPVSEPPTTVRDRITFAVQAFRTGASVGSTS